MAMGAQKNFKIHEKREFTGSVPNTKLIAFKKPYKEPPDYMLLRSTKQKELRDTFQDYVTSHNYFKFVGINEYANDCTMVRNVMRRRLLNRRKTFEELLDKKRERLANLLQSEDEKYHAEFETLFPTYEEKLTAFLKNVNQIKRQNIEEMNRVAADMYEKRWNKNCDELREHVRSLTYKACARDNLATIPLRNQVRSVNEADNRYLMGLMDRKMEAADLAREKVRLEKVRETKKASDLNRQLAKERLDKEEAEKRQEVEEGLQRFREVQAEEAERRQKEHRERLERQAIARQQLQKQMLLHEKKLALNKEVNDIMNAKFLEEKAIFQRKEEQKQKALRQQFMAAKEFAQKIKEEERSKEQKFEACVKTMMDAAAKKTNDMLREREAQQKVYIMDAKQQCDRLLANKEAKKEAQKEEKEMEKEAAVKMSKETAEIMERNKAFRWQKARAHQTDLVAQIAYNEHLKELDEEERRRERQKMHDAECDYHARIQRALADATIGNVHPVRMKMLGAAGMK